MLVVGWNVVVNDVVMLSKKRIPKKQFRMEYSTKKWNILKKIEYSKKKWNILNKKRIFQKK